MPADRPTPTEPGALVSGEMYLRAFTATDDTGHHVLKRARGHGGPFVHVLVRRWVRVAVAAVAVVAVAGRAGWVRAGLVRVGGGGAGQRS